MRAIDMLLTRLREDQIARAVGLRHDGARSGHRLDQITVTDYQEFKRIIGDYYNYHFALCSAHGGRLSPGEAQARAKAILDRQYRRRQGDAMTAFADARDGVNGALRSVIDLLADALKAEAVELYVNQAFDEIVDPSSWEQKVELVRQFISRCGVDLSASIRADQPERYARDYRELVQAYVEGLRDTSRHFRRL